jgi:hypothetical protein
MSFWSSLKRSPLNSSQGLIVWSRSRDRGKAGPALVTKIADSATTMTHPGKTYARAARDGVGKADPCFISLLKNNLVKQQVLQNCRISTTLEIELSSTLFLRSQ